MIMTIENLKKVSKRVREITHKDLREKPLLNVRGKTMGR